MSMQFFNIERGYNPILSLFFLLLVVVNYYFFTLYSVFNFYFDNFQVLQEAKEKSEVESKQNNQIEIRKEYAYLLDSFQGNKLCIYYHYTIYQY